MAKDEHTSMAETAAYAVPQRERPWLLPYNRKLRHLQAITIRNLTLQPPPSRPRGKTIDDEALPFTLKSPAKALAQRETRKLEHSRSSSDLRPINESAIHDDGEAVEKNKTKQLGTPLRPSFAKMRRRSTMDWSGLSPLQKQKKLEEVTAARMADVFYSLHVEGVEDPVYVSEVAEKAMNPNFRFFDLSSCGPAVTRLEDLTVRVWAKTEAVQDYQFLVELTINFRSLQFIGKALENFHHPLPHNSILFHLTDGVYTTFTDLPTEAPLTASLPAPAPVPTKPSLAKPLPTSSYDALMRLSTLDDCIQDALTTREKLAAEISALLQSNEPALTLARRIPELHDRIQTVSSAVNTQRRRLDATQKRCADLRASIASRRQLMREGHAAQAAAESAITTAQPELDDAKKALQATGEAITAQRRRVCEDLGSIYPIEPIAGRALAFTIRGLRLPNSEFEDMGDEDEVAAALGWVAQVVLQLSAYLGVGVPYPVRPHGSTSVVEDPVSLATTATTASAVTATAAGGAAATSAARIYPLFPRHALRYRFEYAVFLLNKDIEILANWMGIRLIDIRQTLPNLKYLLYVATAGTGEVVGRKAGGVRGLLRVDLKKGGKEEVEAGEQAARKLREVASANGKVEVGKGDGNGAVGGYGKVQRAVQESKLREVS
ncbi:hypothetical protein W97_08314 [Coniosporium apollinis CBS 100218]|uniref:Autophagy-related protein 14 n=1 Tax=Coniosporium apollinis (strain CBS 100218) TaxID=1168221 RepID=R7Z4W8_CONA1|nr:uncharacterized protein W97_08314 [Coniosporium apollinis CBS 100218]EON69128.1 hypothetical protein W97_08314 [Coniosporium apollinis CBS 100218]